MNNIFRIFRGDLHMIRRNLVAWAIIIGLLVVPCLYSWFNISASWDPYGKTGNLKIALANCDKGYDGELVDAGINYGDNLISQVAINKKFDWVVTDADEAIEGTKSGEYYAAVIVPETFSADLISVFSPDVHTSELVYYVNEKENAIAPTLTLKGAKSISVDVTETFNAAVMEIVINLAKQFTDNGTGESASELLGNVNTTVLHVKTIIDNAYYSVGSLSLATASIDDMLQSTAELAQVLKDTAGKGQGLSTEISTNVGTLLKSLDSDISELEAFLESLQDLGLPVQDLVAKTKAVKADLETLKSNLNDVNNTSNKTLSQLTTVASNISKISKNTSRSLKSLEKALDDTKKLLASTSASMASISEKLTTATETGDTSVLKDIFSNDSAELSTFLIAPVQLNRHAVFHVENYGSAMAPFYTTLAIWVGATLLVALMSVSLTESRRRELDRLKEYQVYLGKYILFGIMGIVQALLICLGDLYYLGIQCHHPLLFIFAGLYGSIVFGSIVYSLTVSFGNIGKAVAVIIMVIQVAGSGGTFPIETTPAFFQAVYPFLPFPHLMNAMRETIGGMYGNTYWLELGQLTFFLIGALLLGLLLRRPIIKLNIAFNKKLEDTRLM